MLSCRCTRQCGEPRWLGRWSDCHPPSRSRARVLCFSPEASDRSSPGRTREQRRADMKLYYAPGACSIGIHVLLEEIGKPYETERVNLQQGEQYKAPFTDINPKSKVPALARDDGSVLTEFPAIAYWLAKTNPSAKLLPDDVDQQARALELTD